MWRRRLDLISIPASAAPVSGVRVHLNHCYCGIYGDLSDSGAGGSTHDTVM
jgi:hypothetical protein